MGNSWPKLSDENLLSSPPVAHIPNKPYIAPWKSFDSLSSLIRPIFKNKCYARKKYSQT